jgi:predicted nicotinamide N-methyase
MVASMKQAEKPTTDIPSPLTGEAREDGVPELARLPLIVHEIEIGGRDWRIEAVEDQSALSARSEEFEHFPFGLLLWDSAPVLAGALFEQPDLVAGKTVLELGAGVGVAGLVAAALGGRVTQTDHGREALALCQSNAASNGIAGIEWAMADWTDWREERRYGVILGSDILYEADHHQPLARILERNLAPGGRVLLSDPGRTSTPKFLTLLESGGWQLARRRRRVPAITPARPGETVVVTLVEAWR